jgi:hypothetical protein
MSKTPAELDREIVAWGNDVGLTEFLAAAGFRRRDTGAVRIKLPSGKEITVFVNERGTKGKVVISRQYSFGTQRNTYKDRARALAALLEIRY